MPSKAFLEKAFRDVFRHEIFEASDLEMSRAKSRKDCGKFEAKLW